MSSILDSFFVSLGFSVDDSNAEKYASSLESLRSAAFGLVGVFTAAVAGIGALTLSAAESMGELSDFAELNDLSASTLAGLAANGYEYDISLQAVESTMQGLNTIIGQAASGIGRGAMMMKKFGIEAKNADGSTRDVRDVLADVADQMQDMSAGERLNMASRLGIDANFTKILKEGRDAFTDWYDSSKGMFTDEDYDMADKVDTLWQRAQKTFSGLHNVIAVSLFPAVKEMLEMFLAWWKAAKPEIVQKLKDFFNGLAKAVKIVGASLWSIVVTGYKLLEWISKFRVLADAVKLAFAAWVSYKIYGLFAELATAVWSAAGAMRAFSLASLSAVAIPVLIGAAIAAVLLLAEDVYQFIQGNDSLIGRAAKKWPWMASLIENVRTAVIWLGESFMSAWNGYILPFVTNVAEWFMRMYRQIIVPVATGIYDMFATAIPPLWDLISTYLGMVWDYWSFVFGSIGSLVTWFFGLFSSKSQEAGGEAAALGEVLKATFQIVGYMIQGAALALKAFIEDIKWAVEKAEELAGVKLTEQQKGESRAFWRNRASEMTDTLAMGAALAGASPGAPSPVLGAAGTLVAPTQVNDSSQQNNTFHITSTDPDKAGSSVADALAKLHAKKAIRNGQSKVHQ